MLRVAGKDGSVGCLVEQHCSTVSPGRGTVRERAA